MSALPAPRSLRHHALDLLRLADPAAKAAGTRALYEAWQADPDVLAPNPHETLSEPPDLPGRPALPLLVPPKDVPSRSAFTPDGRAGLLHSIAHIEFNAIKFGIYFSNNGVP